MNYNNPFIKVDWEDTPENLTQERIKRVKEYFKKKFNTNDVKVVTKVLSNNSNAKLKSLDVSDNILDPQYQKNLMKDFMKENKIETSWDLIDRLDNRVNGEIDKITQNKVRYNKWYIEKIEFSNFLSFGDDNEIDFTKLGGITVIEGEPRNFSGKTTLSTNLLSFLFFNKTEKNKTNEGIFNLYRDKDEVKVKGHVVIDGDKYIIERLVTRKKTKAGEYNVKSDLEFYKISENGDVINLSGEQRRETETFITSSIGTEEDFLLTILTTGRNLEEMIEFKPTARGQVLTRFLGLDNLKQKEEKCKEIYSEWSKKLISNTYNIVQLETDNNGYNENIIKFENDIKSSTITLNDTEDKLKEIEKKKETLLQSKNNNLDQDLMKINPVLLERENDDNIKKQQNIQNQTEQIKVVEPSKFYLEDDHESIKSKINDLTIDLKLTVDEIKRNEKTINDLKYGTICPTCKRKLDDVDHTKEIDDLERSIDTLNSKKSNLESDINKSKETEGDFSSLKKQYDEYERNKLIKEKHKLEIDQLQLIIDKNKKRLDDYQTIKQKLEENQKIDGEIIAIKTRIDTLNAEIRILNNNIERSKNEIKNFNDKISTNLELIKKIKQEEDVLTVFKTYLNIFGKNGITKVIIKNMIPLLNQELHRLLVDSCYFTLELNINDKNEVEFLMIDNETRLVKSISTGSGYEKTISSLAIRSVLTKICTLPKPNIVVMDEVFGKIADENLEMVGEFFKKIKNYFEHIFVISHNPLIRNWSDNVIVVKKEENVSSIDEIITKIS